MANSKTVTFRADEHMDHQLEQLATATDRTKSWHVQQAVEVYLELQSWQIGEVRKGLADMEAGRVVSHDKVGKWLKSWGKDDEQNAPL
ncbi:MAG: hypothetical protein COA69_14245 [Robiginitomaculum sp.]|nr:MAG: hypothetical protein COA69_14245 [Robiginitomaculum sp.]